MRSGKKGRPTSNPQITENHWKSLKISEHQLKSIKIYEQL
jgi:hypothetical protein